MENEDGYLLVDDGSTVDCELTLEELIAQMPTPKEKVVRGTFGIFSIKDFEKVAGGLTHVSSNL